MKEGTMNTITTSLESVSGNIEIIGAAIVGLAVVVFGFRWIKAQFF